MDSNRGKLFVLLPLIIFISILLSSCNSDPVTTVPITVSGQVGYDFGYLQNAKVEINGNVVTTDSKGKFSIPDVTVPYDIKVMTSNGLDVIIYKGLSVSSPYINFEPGYIQTTSKQGAQIISTLDTMPGSNQKTYSVFIPDEGQPEALSYYFGGTAQSEIRTAFYWFGGPVIKGKIIVMVYTVLGNRISKFDKYYEKSGLTINDNSIDSIVFDHPVSFISHGSVSGTVENHYTYPAHIKMKLKFKNSVSQLPLDNIPSAYYFNFIIPNNIPEPFKVSIEAEEGNRYGKKEVQHGTHNNIIKLYKSVDLITPANNDTGSLNNTIYSWNSPVDVFNIYELELKCIGGPYRRIRVIGSTLNTLIPSLNNIGYNHYGGGVSYIWSVKKHFGLTDINEFVNGNFRNAPAYQGYSGTASRYLMMY